MAKAVDDNFEIFTYGVSFEAAAFAVPGTSSSIHPADHDAVPGRTPGSGATSKHPLFMSTSPPSSWSTKDSFTAVADKSEAAPDMAECHGESSE